MVLRKLSQSLKFFLAVMVTVFSSGLMPGAVAYASDHNNGPQGPDPKVFVCKYVGTPFVNETLQTGQNPISVSVNAIPNYQGVGSYFADQQGRSYVLSVDNTAPGPAGDPSVSACPQPQNNVTPLAPTLLPLCGPNNDTVVIPTQTGVTFNSTGWVNGSLTVTAVAQQGYVLQGQASWIFTDLNFPCFIMVTPPAPTFSPLCGANNDSVTIPTHMGVLYDSTGWVNGSQTITATALPGFLVTGQTSWTFTDENVACPIEVTPSTPSKDDVCELEDDTFTIPSKTGVEYRINGNVVAAGEHSTGDALSVTVTAHAVTGYVLTGTTSWTLTFTDEECEDNKEKYSICHATGSESHPYQLIPQISAAGIYNGHLDDDFGGEHGDHQNGEDIIPPFEYQGETYSQNWDAEGQAIYRAGCEVEEEEPQANISAAVVCVQNGVKVTLVNSGDADGSATVNGDSVDVPANSSVEVVLDYDLGTPFMTDVIVTVGETTLIDQVVNCTPGQGGQTQGTSTTTTPQTLGTTLPATLPATGGEQNPLMIVLASLIAYGAAYFLQGRRMIGRKEALEA